MARESFEEIPQYLILANNSVLDVADKSADASRLKHPSNEKAHPNKLIRYVFLKRERRAYKWSATWIELGTRDLPYCAGETSRRIETSVASKVDADVVDRAAHLITTCITI